MRLLSTLGIYDLELLSKMDALGTFSINLYESSGVDVPWD